MVDFTKCKSIIKHKLKKKKKIEEQECFTGYLHMYLIFLTTLAASNYFAFFTVKDAFPKTQRRGS